MAQGAEVGDLVVEVMGDGGEAVEEEDCEFGCLLELKLEGRDVNVVIG